MAVSDKETKSKFRLNNIRRSYDGDKIFKILIFSDEWGDVFKSIFLHSNYQVDITTDIEKAKRQIKDCDGVILDLEINLQLSFDQNKKILEGLLEYIKSNCPFLPVIIVTGDPSNRISRLIKEFGVYNVFSKIDIHKINLKQAMRDAITECNRKVKKIFISSASEDYRIAKKLYDDLKQPGISPWLAPMDIRAGEAWGRKIITVIEESDYFLTLLSHKSVSKTGFFQNEQKMALKVIDTIPENKVFIIPARLDDCEIPEYLEKFHYINLFPSYEEGFKKILQSIAS